MSAKVIPIRRNAVRVSKKTSVPKFVQVPFAGLLDMFEQEASIANGSEVADSRSPDVESSDGRVRADESAASYCDPSP
jgi:hypothetical protein